MHNNIDLDDINRRLRELREDGGAHIDVSNDSPAFESASTLPSSIATATAASGDSGLPGDRARA